MTGYRRLVIDLEFNPVKRLPEQEDPSHLLNYEIIEIAAVILDDDNKICDRFQCYVRPEHADSIAPEITKLTGITYDDVKDAECYEEALDSFIEWVGDRKITAYSWSKTDKLQIMREAEFKGFLPKAQAVFPRWIDLQRIYSRKMGLTRPANLTTALNILQITFVGAEHSALADAENTAQILAMLCDSKRMDELKSRSRVTFNSKDMGGFKLSDMIKVKTRKK